MQCRAWLLVVGMAASGAGLAAPTAADGASVGVAASGGGYDPAPDFIRWQAERAAEKERIGSLVERNMLDAAAYERAADAERFIRPCDTGVLVPVQGIRALKKRNAMEAASAAALLQQMGEDRL